MKTLLALLLLAGGLWAEKLPAEKATIAHYAYADDGTILPDPSATPGEVLTTDSSIVCVSGYAKKARKQVKTSTLKEAVAGYGVKWQPKLEEADHLISIELGGAPASILNLWPQPREKRITRPSTVRTSGTPRAAVAPKYTAP